MIKHICFIPTFFDTLDVRTDISSSDLYESIFNNICVMFKSDHSYIIERYMKRKVN